MVARLQTHTIERKNGLYWEWYHGRETYSVKFIRVFSTGGGRKIFFLEGVWGSQWEAVKDSDWYRKRRERAVRVVKAGGGNYAVYSREKDW